MAQSNGSNQEISTQSRQVVLAVCDNTFGNAILECVAKHKWEGAPTFHLVFIVDLGALKVVAKDVVDDIRSEDNCYGETLLRKLSLRLKEFVPDCTIVTHVIEGDSAHEILKLCQQVNASMLVMGSHGRTGLRRVLLGSVSADVVAQAGCSTIIVRVPNSEELLTVSGPPAISTSDLPENMTTYASTAD